MAVELYLGKLCPLCTGIHVLTIVAIIAARSNKVRLIPLPLRQLPDNWSTLVWIGALLFGTPIAYFNGIHYYQRSMAGGNEVSLIDW